MKILKWTLSIVLTLFIIVVLGGYLWLKSTVPDYDGRIAAPVAAPVKIVRDGYGVPYILAESERDGFTAVGYAMAQTSDELTNVGPVVCIGPRCESLLLESIGLVLEGREAFLTTRRGQNEALLGDLGLKLDFGVVRMVRGPEPEGNPDTVLAIGALEKG